MASWVVFASGTGTNFRALIEVLSPLGKRPLALVSDVPACSAVTYAKDNKIPVLLMNYQGITRMQAENKLLDQLERFGNVQLVVLAGFMRVLSPYFLNSFPGTIINIHPSLLPRHPGRNGLADSLGSQDEELGITIHYVDEGVDTGKIIVQESFVRDAQEPFDSLEAKIHAIEHRLYPQVVLGLLNRFDTSEALN